MTERELKKYLRELSGSVSAFLAELDRLMDTPDSFERGKKIAAAANELDYANDQVRYFALGVNFRTDRKRSAAVPLPVPASQDRTPT